MVVASVATCDRSFNIHGALILAELYSVNQVTDLAVGLAANVNMAFADLLISPATGLIVALTSSPVANLNHIIVFVVNLTVAFITGLTTGLVVGLTAGFTAGLVAGFTAGLVAGRAAHLAAGLTTGPVEGLASGIVAALVAGLFAGLTAGLVAGLTTGLAGSLITSLIASNVVGPRGFADGLSGSLVQANFNAGPAAGTVEIDGGRPSTNVNGDRICVSVATVSSQHCHQQPQFKMFINQR